MLSRIATFVLTIALAAIPSLASAAETHSGVVTAIDPARHTVTIGEMGPWHGPTTTPATRVVVIPPGTRMQLVVRSRTAAPGGWPGAYRESPLTLGQVHTGDFVTLAVTRQGGRDTAVSLDVVRPSNG
jgi:hypothetical protein